MLQNLQYKLTEPLPLHIRKEVYEKAIIYYRELDKYGRNDNLKDYGTGLCMSLPCFLYNLEHWYNDRSVNWNYQDTPTAFPEIRRFTRIASNDIDYCTIRVGILEQCLEIVNKAIENETF